VILATGATGNVGGELVAQLAQAGEPVRALVRDSSASLPAGATAVIGDLNDPAGLGSALEGVEAMFLLSGYDNLPELLRRAHRAGVARVVLLSGSAAGARDTDNSLSRYLLASEAAVRDSQLGWTVLRPVAFMTNTLQWADQLRASNSVRVPFAGVRAAVVDPHDIAAVAAVALRSEEHHGRTYAVTGPQSLSPAQRLATLGEALERELELVALSDEQARADMAATTPPEYIHAFTRFYADGMLDESEVRPTVGAVTGRPPRTFRSWADAHASAFPG
jgi:uncharacterized protein YbjT (DUF2867 family)